MTAGPADAAIGGVAGQRADATPATDGDPGAGARDRSGRLDALTRDAAAAYPDRVALVSATVRRTFAELEARIDRLAAALAARTDPGDRVAILAGNRAEYAEAYLGVPRAGARLVPLHPRLHPDEWLRLLRRARARVLVAEPGPLARIGERARRDAGIELVVGLPSPATETVTGEGSPGTSSPGREDRPGGDCTYEDLLADAPVTPGATPGGAAQVDRAGAPTGRDDPEGVAWMVPTSGTTGPPRLAMLTHTGLLAAVRATLAARPLTGDDVLATPFPLCHVAGYNLLVFWARARPVVLLRGFDPDELLRVTDAEGVTTLSLAPTMIAALLDHLAATGHPGGRPLGPVRRITYGASPIPPPVLRRAVTELGVELSQGYGMTELSGNAVFLGPEAHQAAARGDDRLLRAAGRPAPGVAVRIAAAGDRRSGTGHVGEILIRAPQVMAGYWEDPEATAATLVDGWLRTGDIGRIDGHGDLHVLDRRKDVIVTGGENVASREVEDVLATHPAVAEVAVIGLPDERWGEHVTAVVVPRAGHPPPTLAELDAHVRARLAAFKVPRRLVLLDELPRNHAGKIAKRTLRDQLRDQPRVRPRDP